MRAYDGLWCVQNTDGAFDSIRERGDDPGGTHTWRYTNRDRQTMHLRRSAFIDDVCLRRSAIGDDDKIPLTI